MADRKKTTRKDNSTSEAIGAGVGVVGGAAAGAAIGSLGGPVGTAIGAVAGGLAGGFAGKEVADYIDPAEEETHWQEQFPSRPYYREGANFEEYRPAYRYGVEAANKYPGKRFDEVETRLGRSWPRNRGESRLTWGKARDAVRDAFDRTFQLHEERLRVEKQSVETGSATVHKEVVTERKKIDVPVEREEVVVTRRPASGRGRGRIEPDQEEIRIPVKEERVKVTKETVPTEEVTVRRRKVRDVKRIEEPVRREEVHVEQKGDVKVRGGSRTTRTAGTDSKR